MAQSQSTSASEQFDNDRQRKGVTGARNGDIRPAYAEPNEDGGLVVKVKNSDPSEGDESMYRTMVSPHGVASGCHCPDQSYNLPTTDDKGRPVGKCKHQHAVDKLLAEIGMYVRDDRMDERDAVARVPGNEIAVKVIYHFLDEQFED